MEMQKAVHAEFKRHGLTLRKMSVRLVAEYVSEKVKQSGSRPEEELEDVAQIMFEGVEKRNMRSSILDDKLVEEIILALFQKGEADAGPSTEIISAFEMPRFSYDCIKRAFYKVATPASVFAQAHAKISLYQERLQMLQHRVQRNKFFSKPMLEVSTGKRDYCELATVQGVMQSRGETRYLLGLLTEIEDGAIFLEDATGSVRADLTNAVPTAGMFTENCIIVAEGALRRDDVFQVNFLGFPSCESREDFGIATGGENFFGGADVRLEDVPKKLELEQQAEHEMFVVIADLWLDRPECVANFRAVMEGFESVPNVPSHFILMGNFTSAPVSAVSGDLRQIAAHFDALAELICCFPRIKEHATFVLIPGPHDPAPSPALPRPPLTSLFTKKFMQLLPNSQFTSNPCRIRFHSQELVFFRADMQSRMRRLCRLDINTSETEILFKHMAMTMLQQGNLCPLPLSVQPVYWEFDQALRLYSTPQALVLADFAAEQIDFPYQDADCNCFNPGSFGNSGSFGVYLPGKRSVQLSGIN